MGLEQLSLHNHTAVLIIECFVGCKSCYLFSFIGSDNKLCA